MLKPRKSLKTLILLLLILLGLGMVILAWLTQPKSSAVIQEAFTQSKIVKPFELRFKHNAFTEKDIKDHWTLLFFGYSHCSDVCPTTLTVLNQVYNTLHPRYPRLQVVFVSIDEKDRADHIAHYVASFNPAFIGTSAHSEKLAALKQQFGIYAEPNTDTDIQHSSSVLLINPKGEWVSLFHYGMPATEMTQTFIKIAGASHD